MKTNSLRIGDRFKDKTTQKIYVVTLVIGRYSVLLEGENGMGRRITDEGNLQRTCEKQERKES
jgi:hypothetical protein